MLNTDGYLQSSAPVRYSLSKAHAQRPRNTRWVSQNSEDINMIACPSSSLIRIVERIFSKRVSRKPANALDRVLCVAKQFCFSRQKASLASVYKSNFFHYLFTSAKRTYVILTTSITIVIWSITTNTTLFLSKLHYTVVVWRYVFCDGDSVSRFSALFADFFQTKRSFPAHLVLDFSIL